MNAKKLKIIYGKLEDIRDAVANIKDAAEIVFDNRSDTWRESETGQAEQDRISYLETAISDTESALENLENAYFDSGS